MKCDIETITPEKAREYLGKNTDNYRKLNQIRITSYAADMKSGRWQLNGEAIKFAKSGVLLDGQHRLYAIIRADTPVQMLVIYDIDDDTNIYDIGSARSLGAILRKNGIADGNYVVLASVGNFVVNNGYTHTYSGSSAVVEYVEKNIEAFQKSCSATSLGRKKPICRKSPIIAAVYCLLRRGEDLCEINNFFQIANSGLPYGYYDPSSALIFRNTLQEINANSFEQRKALFCITLQAIRDFLTNTPRKFKYRANLKELELLHEIRLEDGLCDK